MSDPFEMGRSSRHGPGDQCLDEMGGPSDEPAKPAHPCDSDEARREHRRILGWYYLERERQAENRMQMATDNDFYDNEQWKAEDAAEVEGRGQMPLNFNEVAPMADWLIGTERRTRVDWNVLPRAEDDVDLADAKTKTLKYVSDVNRAAFARSRAFADSVKVGVGWVDDGARDDPTKDVLYSRYEDWRNVLWDSIGGYDLDLEDGRYLFRWRWTDEDVAEMSFPDRVDQIRRALVDAGTTADDSAALDDGFYLGEAIGTSGTMYASNGGVLTGTRRRIRLIECQYRKPTKVQIVDDGPWKGSVLDPSDRVLNEHVQQSGVSIVERVMMRVHIMIFTETAILAMGPSTYRHNRYTLTPIWCYRRGRDRLPYGVIRRVRDLQQDLNKRASKALFMLNTNQVFTEPDAVADPDHARSEVDRPDGWVEIKKGAKFEVRRDTDGATGQIQMMTLDAQKIQQTAGVNNENLGRATNAVSGAAIEARQMQGSVGTTEPFDNLSFAVQVQGEKQLSLTEQFYTEAKVIRLTGTKGKIEWLKINQPEEQPDGSMRYLNDITASAADFVVSERDYAGTLRKVMFESISKLAERLPPEVGLRLFITAMEFSDLPNKDEIAGEIRRVIGERDPNKEMTPEEAQAAEQQAQMQAEALQVQREAAVLALEEQRAKVRKLNAEADKLINEGGASPEAEQAVRQVQEQAATEIDRLTKELVKAQVDAANKTVAINREADVKVETARIEADANIQIAEINAKASTKIDALEKRLAELAETVAQSSAAPAKGAKSAKDK